MAGLFTVSAVLVDRRLARRHERRAALRSAVNELAATASVLPFGVEAETLRRDTAGVMAHLVAGLDRMLMAHATVELLGAKELRAASEGLINAVADCVQATTTKFGRWSLLTGRARTDERSSMTALSTAIQSLKDAARRFVD